MSAINSSCFLFFPIVASVYQISDMFTMLIRIAYMKKKIKESLKSVFIVNNK